MDTLVVTIAISVSASLGVWLSRPSAPLWSHFNATSTCFAIAIDCNENRIEHLPRSVSKTGKHIWLAHFCFMLCAAVLVWYSPGQKYWWQLHSREQLVVWKAACMVSHPCHPYKRQLTYRMFGFQSRRPPTVDGSWCFQNIFIMDSRKLAALDNVVSFPRGAFVSDMDRAE